MDFLEVQSFITNNIYMYILMCKCVRITSMTNKTINNLFLIINEILILIIQFQNILYLSTPYTSEYIPFCICFPVVIIYSK